MEDLKKKAVKLEKLLTQEAKLDCKVTVQNENSLLITYRDLSINQQKFISNLNGQFSDTFIYYICEKPENGIYNIPDYSDADD